MSDLLPYAERDERDARTAFFLPLLAAAMILALIGVISVATGGGDDVIEDPATLIRSAPDALQDAGSARMAMTMSMAGDGMSMDMGGEGVVDFVTGAATFEMSVMGQKMELRTDGTSLWMRMPPMALPPGVDGSWVEVPVDDIPGMPAGGMAGAPSDGYVDMLRGLSSEVEDLGTEEIDGVETHHYRFEVSIESALDQLDQEDRAEMEETFSQLGDVDSFPVEAWITDDGLPLRQVMTIDMGELLDGTMTMTLELSDFGVDVDVEPPPADEIISLEDNPELGEMFGSGTTS